MTIQLMIKIKIKILEFLATPKTGEKEPRIMFAGKN